MQIAWAIVENSGILIICMVSGILSQPIQPDSDESLIHRIVEGQSSALGELYDRYGRLVYSLAYHVVGDSAIAEEIAQEVFLQVWNKAATYQAEQGKVVSWLTSIARHKAIDSLRRKGARPEGHQVGFETEDEWDLVDPAGVEEQVETTQRGQAIRRAIARLPAEQQKALSLAYFKGMTHQEVADLIGEPLGTVKTRIRLALLKLRQLLESEKIPPA
jgi:RNA polymerase sigma-70 factor, ECF subfamily